MYMNIKENKKNIPADRRDVLQDQSTMFFTRVRSNIAASVRTGIAHRSC